MKHVFHIIVLAFAALFASVANAQTTNYPLSPIVLDFCRYAGDEAENALHTRISGDVAGHWVVDMHPFKEKWGEQAAVQTEAELLSRSKYLFSHPEVYRGMAPSLVRIIVYEGCMKDAIKKGN